MDIGDVRFRIAAARRMLYREGCDSGNAGHVSVRADGAEALWISPLEYFDETLPDRVSKIGFDLRLLEGTWEPSPAVEFHARIYEERPDVGAIIHTHSFWVGVLASRPQQLVGMYNVAATMFHDDQAYYEEDGVRRTVEGKAVAAELGSRSVLLMKNHGAVVASDTLEGATVRAMLLEQSAHYHVECERFGATEMNENEVLRQASLWRDYAIGNIWNSNLNRLQKSDPDLFVTRLQAALPTAPADTVPGGM